MLEWIYGKILPDAYAEEHVTRLTQRHLTDRLCNDGYEILDCQYVGGAEVIFKARKR